MNTRERYEYLDKRMKELKGKCTDLDFLDMHLEKMPLMRQLEKEEGQWPQKP